MGCTALIPRDYVVHVSRAGTGRFPELEPEGSQSLGVRTHRDIASSG